MRRSVVLVGCASLWMLLAVPLGNAVRREESEDESSEDQRSATVRNAMGLGGGVADDAKADRVTKGEGEKKETAKPPTFEDSVEEDMKRSREKFRFLRKFRSRLFDETRKESRQEKAKNALNPKPIPSLSINECCRVCPEMFEGVDIVPSQSFVEKQKMYKMKSPSSMQSDLVAAQEMASLKTLGWGTRRFKSTNARVDDALDPTGSVLESAGNILASVEKEYLMQSFIEIGARFAGEKKLTMEEFIETIPCCPVCLDQLDPPADMDDASTAFIELGFLGSSTRKLKNEMSCCTLCPDDSIPTHRQYDGSRSMSFLEFFGSSTKPLKPMDKRIRSDGCCNFCSASITENQEDRYQDINGGPFGLNPRIRSVSGSVPTMAPTPLSKKKIKIVSSNYRKTQTDVGKFLLGEVR